MEGIEGDSWRERGFSLIVYLRSLNRGSCAGYTLYSYSGKGTRVQIPTRVTKNESKRYPLWVVKEFLYSNVGQLCQLGGTKDQGTSERGFLQWIVLSPRNKRGVDRAVHRNGKEKGKGSIEEIKRP